jgi:ADP-ribose pyrophosphatase
MPGKKRRTSFRVTAEREVFKGRIFSLKTKHVVLPNGRRTLLNIVEHPGAVAIVPIFENGDVLLIRQLRVAAGGELYEIPAGTLEKGEAPVETARREIVEETGFRARSMRKLAEFFTAPGFCTEKMHLFVAKGLSAAHAEKDDDEIIRPLRLPYAKALRLVRTGRIRDAKSIVGLLLASHGRR